MFFIVGGYANAASLASHRRHGDDAITWLQDRISVNNRVIWHIEDKSLDRRVLNGSPIGLGSLLKMSAR